ncbi:iron-containing alcohol dehydrogenase [Aliidiomarina halalkaliphila]|uniref:Iron-containing alcohol dehydrogenase n=1 Tax=Aliidiomarina halalkaliphila TaxID=2593535 RepID=A0A552WZ90_9GAMM|nr:iron-containing alcohol dehydrogenase [Aliidiomarina halalkaliphila]TRW48117.1 iron-containing alcohol dehydrogenase [Aliidiomarina halalkaliphila]
MNNFSFYNPTKIIFGEGQIASIAKEIPVEARVMLAYGGGSIKNNGVYDQVIDALGERIVCEFSGIEANPEFDTLCRAADAVNEHRITFILAVGGGSVIDGVKFIAAAAQYNGDRWDILTKGGKVIQSAVPFGSVLTLPATGSEMNSGSVVTRSAMKAKLPFGSPHVYPQFSVLDPVTTYSLPIRQVINGVIDPFTHVMEQYLTYPVGAHLQDRLAEAILKTLIELGPETLAQPKNYEVRANVMWCATMALNGLIGSGVPQDWSTHMIGHELTALYGLDHAQTLAVVLPANLRVRKADKLPKLVQYAERVWGITEGSDEERAEAAITRTEEFFRNLGAGTRIEDYDLSADVIDVIIKQLESHGMVKLGEHRDVTPEVSRKILETALR